MCIIHYIHIHIYRDNDIDELCLGMTFSVDTEVFGEHKTVELIEDGENVEVTNANKQDYVEYVNQKNNASLIRSKNIRDMY